MDIFPTTLEAAGANPSEEKQLEGVSLLPYITEKAVGNPHEELYWRSVGGFEYAVRIGDYKLYKRANAKNLLLFDLKNDSYERKDISRDHPEIVKELERVYMEWDAKNIPPGWEDSHEENVIKEQLRLKAAREKAMRPKGK